MEKELDNYISGESKYTPIMMYYLVMRMTIMLI